MPSLAQLPDDILLEISSHLDHHAHLHALSQISLRLFYLTEPLRHRRLEFRNARCGGGLSRFLQTILAKKPILARYVRELRLAWDPDGEQHPDDLQIVARQRTFAGDKSLVTPHENLLRAEAEFLAPYFQEHGKPFLREESMNFVYHEQWAHWETYNYELGGCYFSSTGRVCMLLQLLPDLHKLTLSEANASDLDGRSDFFSHISVTNYRNRGIDPASFLSNLTHVHISLLDGYEEASWDGGSQGPLHHIEPVFLIRGLKRLSGVGIHAPCDVHCWREDGDWTYMKGASDITELDFRRSDIMNEECLGFVVQVPRRLERFGYEYEYISTDDGFAVSKFNDEVIPHIEANLIDLKLRVRTPRFLYQLGETIQLVNPFPSPFSTPRFNFLQTLTTDLFLLLGPRPTTPAPISPTPPQPQLQLSTLLPPNIHSLTLYLHSPAFSPRLSLNNFRRDIWVTTTYTDEECEWSLPDAVPYLLDMLEEKGRGAEVLPRLRWLEVGFGDGDLPEGWDEEAIAGGWEGCG
ncbi:hypothetical protein DFH27DRAFT_579325, partial [Peziza echinospora]